MILRKSFDCAHNFYFSTFPLTLVVVANSMIRFSISGLFFSDSFFFVFFAVLLFCCFAISSAWTVETINYLVICTRFLFAYFIDFFEQLFSIDLRSRRFDIIESIDIHAQRESE